MQFPFGMVVVVVVALYGLPGHGDAARLREEQKNKAVLDNMAQIKSTLENLLSSVEEAGKDAENLFAKKRRWCADSSAARARVVSESKEALAKLQADLKEHAAAAEEQQALVEQTKDDVKTENATLNRTTDLAASTHAHRRLLSSQGELEAEYSLLALKQNLVAEATRRIRRTQATLSADEAVVAALAEDCGRTENLARTQAMTRVSEAVGLEEALHAVAGQQLARGPDGGHPQGRALRGGKASSLLQVSDGTRVTSGQGKSPVLEHDLSVLLSPETQKEEGEPLLPSKSSSARGGGEAESALAEAKAGFAALLDGFKSGRKEQQRWCSHEKEKSKLAVQEAADHVQRLTASMQAHTAAIKDLGGALALVQSDSNALKAVAEQVYANGVAEAGLLKTQLKDQKLARRILDRLIDILSTSHILAHPEEDNDGDVDEAKPVSLLQTTRNQHRVSLHRESGGLVQAVEGLKSVRNLFQNQVNASESDAAIRSANRVKEVAQSALDAKHRQQGNLDLAQAKHQEALAQETEELGLAQKELSDAQTYVKNLEKGCKNSQRAALNREEAVQPVFSEDDMEKKSNLAAVDMSKLSPLQRAAARMGVHFN